MKAAFVTILIFVFSAGVSLADTRTTRGKLKAVRERVLPDTAGLDTAAVLSCDSLVVAGYDKALRSGKESFRVTNRFCRTVKSIVVDIVYHDVKGGDMIHARTVNLGCDIPPGETRQLEWGAWDRQNRYYYYDTRVTPRSPKAVAYDVTIYPRDARFGVD